ncbi:hypothetical protein MML48_1g15477 [Holotrichia oblita]|uniref:Uncharacterized protein n=1 Tax=Holotrichia oblita TaxID=644536 RepID=A0ACB9TRW1_HOLOL|nr:hypothetical protein MML48_1g15477 [Holotrichia oblita]
MNDNDHNHLNKVIYMGTAIVKEVIGIALESDGSDSDVEYNFLEDTYFYYNQRRPSKIAARVSTYTKLNDSDFRSHFRLTKGSVEILIKLMYKDWQQNLGRIPTDIKLGIMLSLWYLATKETFREVGDRFDVSRGQAHRICTKFNTLLCTHVKKIIKWPTREEMVNIVNDFNRLRGHLSFPNVFGCVDGTHIEIPKPMNGNSYYNRKGYYSIVIQAICDAKMYFLDIFVGWLGLLVTAEFGEIVLFMRN